MADQLLGLVIEDRYRLVRQLGRGSFGQVYEAEELFGGEVVGRVAVKLLTPGPEQQRLLVREIHALAGLHHPHVLLYRVSGTMPLGVAEAVYIVTELADGTLSDELGRSGPLRVEQVRPVAAALVQALAYLHSQGLIHRDLKPANLFRVGDTWKVGDFGLVRAFGDSQTAASGIMGTFTHMAPEMFRGQVGPASDIYALGVTLLEAFTGRPAHEASSQAELMHKVLEEPPNIPAELPEPYRSAIERCLAKDPAARPSAGDLLAALGLSATHDPTHAVLHTAPAPVPPGPVPPPRPPRWWWSAVGALLLLGMGLVAMAWLRGSSLDRALPPYLAKQRRAMPRHLTYRRRDKDGMPQVLVPAGQFSMGASEAQIEQAFDDGRRAIGDRMKREYVADQGPRTKVAVDAFWMDLHDVTNEQYARFLVESRPDEPTRLDWLTVLGDRKPEDLDPQIERRDGRYVAAAGKELYPVVYVTWRGADAYAAWAGARLPTEAQWERAARGGQEGLAYVWGDSAKPPPGAGNLCDETAKRRWSHWVVFAGYDDGYEMTSPAGAFGPNRYGLFDMAGNVWQWCADWYDAGWYRRMPRRNPCNLTPGVTRVLRGGSWSRAPGGLSVTYRNGLVPHTRQSSVGFRCVGGRAAQP